MMIRNIMVLCSIVLLSGCSTYAKGPLFVQATAPAGTMGALYVYHEKSPLVYTPTVLINGKPFVALTKMGYSYVYLKPGIYRLKFDYKALQSSGFSTEILIESGKETFEKYYGAGNHMSITDMSPEDALNELKDYRYVEPLNNSF